MSKFIRLVTPSNIIYTWASRKHNYTISTYKLGYNGGIHIKVPTIDGKGATMWISKETAAQLSKAIAKDFCTNVVHELRVKKRKPYRMTIWQRVKRACRILFSGI